LLIFRAPILLTWTFEIYNKYFTATSPYLLDFEEEVIENVHRAYSEKKFERDMFEGARQTVQILVQDSILPKFQRGVQIENVQTECTPVEVKPSAKTTQSKPHKAVKVPTWECS